jgi:hypothetical protein
LKIVVQRQHPSAQTYHILLKQNNRANQGKLMLFANIFSPGAKARSCPYSARGLFLLIVLIDSVYYPKSA